MLNHTIDMQVPQNLIHMDISQYIIEKQALINYKNNVHNKWQVIILKTSCS